MFDHGSCCTGATLGRWINKVHRIQKSEAPNFWTLILLWCRLAKLTTGREFASRRRLKKTRKSESQKVFTFSTFRDTSTFRDFLTLRLFVFLVTFRLLGLFGTFRLFVFLFDFSFFWSLFDFSTFRFFWVILRLCPCTATRDHRDYKPP